MTARSRVPDYRRLLARRLSTTRLELLRARFRALRATRFPQRRKRLVLVLGSQRSGTNAVRRSLSLDPYLMGFNEAPHGPFYDDYVLRPEPEIRALLRALPHPVLLKPITSVIDRPVADFLGDFAAYDLGVVWIYRDPVNVYSSRMHRWPSLDDVEQFLDEWNRVNRSALAAAASDRRILIVRYEDLIADRDVFVRLRRALDVRGEYLFAKDSAGGYRYLDAPTIERIRQGAGETLAALDGARRFSPRAAGDDPARVAPAPGTGTEPGAA